MLSFCAGPPLLRAGGMRERPQMGSGVKKNVLMAVLASGISALQAALFVQIVPRQTAVYYLDGTAGNDSGCGSAADPWKSFDRAQQTLQSGNTLYCTGELGWIGMTTNSPVGTATDWITYAAWPERSQPHVKSLVFDGNQKDRYLRFEGILFSPGEVDVASYTTNNAVYLQGASYVTFEDCDIEGPQLAIPEGAIDPALGFFPYTPLSPFAPPALTAGHPGDASYITVTGCRIRKSCIGIAVARNPAYTNKLAHHWTVTGNDIDDATEDGIRFGAGGASDSYFAGNYIHNQNMYRHPFNWAGYESSPGVWSNHPWAKVTQEGTGASAIFYQMSSLTDGRKRFYILADDKNYLPSRATTNRWVLDSDSSVWFQGQYTNGAPSTGDNAHTDGISVMGPTKNVLFERNSIEVSPYGGAAMKLEYINGHPENFIFQNNLFYALPYYPGNVGAALLNLAGGRNVLFKHNVIFAGTYSGTGGAVPLARAIRFIDEGGFDGIYFYNNIIGGGGSLATGEAGVATSDCNLWLSEPLPSVATGSHDVILPARSTWENAGFINAAAGDLRIGADSPARDIGSDHPDRTVPTDFSGSPRAGRPDAGAYEVQVL